MKRTLAGFSFSLLLSLVACSNEDPSPCGFEPNTFDENATRTRTVAEGVEFKQAIAVSGQAGSTVYTVVSGDLPPGVQVDGGRFSGAPTTLGAYTFTLRADSTDNTCASSTRSLTVKVVPAECDPTSAHMDDACYAPAVSYGDCKKSSDCPAPEFGGRGYCVPTANGYGVCLDDGTVVSCGWA